MASVLTAPSASDEEVQSGSNPEIHETAGAHSIAARDLVRMGKDATVPAGMNWMTLIVVALFHVGALSAFFFFSWGRLAVMAILYVLAINVGIGMCYHWLLTHRGYQTPKWVEHVMSMCATLSPEGGPIFWVS